MLLYVTVCLSSGPGQNFSQGAVHLLHNSVWSHACDADFDDITACADCRELGFFDGHAICCSAYASVYQLQKNYPNITLHCMGDEESLVEILNRSCTSGLYTSVVCLKESDPGNDTGEDMHNLSEGNLGLNTNEHIGLHMHTCACVCTESQSEGERERVSMCVMMAFTFMVCFLYFYSMTAFILHYCMCICCDSVHSYCTLCLSLLW